MQVLWRKVSGVQCETCMRLRVLVSLADGPIPSCYSPSAMPVRVAIGPLELGWIDSQWNKVYSINVRMYHSAYIIWSDANCLCRGCSSSPQLYQLKIFQWRLVQLTVQLPFSWMGSLWSSLDTVGMFCCVSSIHQCTCHGMCGHREESPSLPAPEHQRDIWHIWPHLLTPAPSLSWGEASWLFHSLSPQNSGKRHQLLSSQHGWWQDTGSDVRSSFPPTSTGSCWNHRW